VIYKIAKVQKGDLSMASTPRVTSASRAVGAPSTRGGTPLEVALRDWLSELRLSNRSQTTIDWYRDLFQGRILPALTRQGIRTVDQIQREHVRELREQLQRDGRRPRHRFDGKVSTERTPLTPASLHAYHRVLRAFYRWCVSEGYSPDRGAGRLPSPREPVREPRVFTGAEIDAMLRLASSRDRLVLEVLLGTGLRVSELSALEISDFRVDHPDGPYLDVRAGKGSKQRAVPLTTVLARKLRRYVTHERPTTSCPALFVTERSGFGRDDRQPLRPAAVQLLIRRLGQRAGIKPGRVSPHTFRHTFATRALSGGMDVLRLQRVLGHTTLSMVSRYVHFGKSELLRGWDRFFDPAA
jgi:integrase/recombinase XerD